jgi:rSAM/selenodomain-associated transferase 1
MTEPLSPLGLGLMCKPPRPGATKTRLAATIGANLAARLSRAFLQDCAYAALEAADLCQLKPMAFFRPADGGAELGEVLGPDWPLVHADAGDLGATMLTVLRQLQDSCPAGALVMGADLPLISSADIAEAARCLRQGDARSVVTIPSVDGGYCLIGVCSVEAAAPLFAPMAWSTSSVLNETLARAVSSGLKLTMLQPQRDIDDINDLDWLREKLRTVSQGARATRAALAAVPQASPQD